MYGYPNSRFNANASNIGMYAFFPQGSCCVDIPRRVCSPPKRGYNRGDKETSLLLMVGDIHGITKSKLTRECIIILLKYGADPSIEDENGISANKWLNSSKEHIELGKLIKNQRIRIL